MDWRAAVLTTSMLASAYCTPSMAEGIPRTTLTRTQPPCSYPQFIMRMGEPKEKPIYTRVYGEGKDTVRVYTLRVDTSDDPFSSIDHLVSVPEFKLVAGISTRLRSRVHVMIRVDHDADGKMENAYDVAVPWWSARSFATEEFPQLLVDAKRSGNVLEHLDTYLSKRSDEVDLKNERKEFDRLRMSGFDRVCDAYSIHGNGR